MPRSLDLVVTSVATQLMEATASTATQVSEKVLAQLVEQFDVDASFLRHHDHDIRASVLVAEWPRANRRPGSGSHGRRPLHQRRPGARPVRTRPETGGDPAGSARPVVSALAQAGRQADLALGGRRTAGVGRARPPVCSASSSSAPANGSKKRSTRSRRSPPCSRSSRRVSRPKKSFAISPSTTI